MQRKRDVCIFLYDPNVRTLQKVREIDLIQLTRTTRFGTTQTATPLHSYSSNRVNWRYRNHSLSTPTRVFCTAALLRRRSLNCSGPVSVTVHFSVFPAPFIMSYPPLKTSEHHSIFH